MKKIALATLAMIPIASTNIHASGETGIVTASSLNVRSGPSTSNSAIFTVKKGEKVYINEKSSGWYKIKTNSGQVGWASSTYIQIQGSNDTDSGNTSENERRVRVDNLNMRSGAGTSYRVITKLSKGTTVEVISESNGWSKIKHDGRLGYVASEYLEEIKVDDSKTTTKEATTNDLNVRSGPSTSYSILGKLKKGEKVEVISESNGWAKIKYNSKTAYVSSRYLKVVSDTSTPPVNPEQPEDVKETKVVNTNGLNVRSGPGTNHGKVGTLNKGEKVGVISESNGWSKIKYDGKVAYVASKYLDKESTQPPVNPEQPDEVKETKVVNTNGLNVRSGPGTNHGKVGTLNKGEKVGVISESNGWSKIKYDGKVAYVASRYLDKESTQPPVNPEQPDEVKETKIVNTNGLNVRSGPGTNHGKVGTLNKGEKVGVISESNGWSKIKYDGKVAYVASRYLDKESTQPPVNPEQPDEVKETKVVNTNGLNVRSGPGTNHGKIGTLNKGDKVGVISESNGWSKIKYNEKEAYVASKYLNKGDGNDGNDGNDESENINGATIIYKSLSYTLNDHINVQLERASIGANVIDSSKPRSSEILTTHKMRETRGFVQADRSDIEYFLNPANFTKSSKGMMQFLRIDSYKGGVSASELNSYLNSLSPASSGTNVFYNQGQAFINAAQKYDIDLAYFVAHAMWETAYGRSTLAQGQTLTSYKGQPLPEPVKVYNFFGIGAIDHSANVSGAEAAYSNGWTSIEATIDGSAKWIAQNYIKSSKYNQNTIHKMKFNYDYSWHQYATDVNWANGISGIMLKIMNMYDTGSNLTFEVPKYKN